MAAEGEEVVVGENLSDVKEFSPDLGQSVLHRPSEWRAAASHHVFTADVGEFGGVQFAVDRHREVRHVHQRGRDHESRQP
ncbi:hypothetical protein AB0C10_20740, partial [Microbispora amethystogenes]|uniref:hypothetical protein n=1 Tax=Microbispora amethystogenes TaxID=1427754 RepID=UPI0034048615